MHTGGSLANYCFIGSRELHDLIKDPQITIISKFKLVIHSILVISRFTCGVGSIILMNASRDQYKAFVFFGPDDHITSTNIKCTISI